MDITFNKISFEIVLIINILFILGVSTIKGLSFRTNLNTIGVSNSKAGWYSLVTIFFISSIFFCLDGDFFSYKFLVQNFNPNRSDNYLEPIYWSIIPSIGNNYLLFRIFVWGGATFLCIKTFKRYYTDKYLGLYILYACYFLTFYYARASLAMACYFYGLSYILDRGENKIFSKSLKNIIIGLVFLFLSYQFHHSMIICIAIAPIVLIPANKKTIIFCLFITGVLVFFLNYFLKDMFDVFAMTDDEYIRRKMLRYSTRNDNLGNLNLINTIKNAIYYTTFYLPFIAVTKGLYFNKENVYNTISIKIESLYKVTLAIIIISFCALGLDFQSLVFFYRILFMIIIPNSILLAYCYRKRIISKRMLFICIVTGIVSQLSRTYYYLNHDII